MAKRYPWYAIIRGSFKVDESVFYGGRDEIVATYLQYFAHLFAS